MMHAATAIKGAALSKEALRLQVRRFLDEDPADDDNLLDFGLTSIDVMKLVTEWKQADIEIDFIALARGPTIDGMWHLLQQRIAANATTGSA
ncbi:phosphopantetheine-binding protein [Rhizobium sp. FKL33]|uniref:phosphopantetheine-binding protein n=1 Tax=Rhizobium sp. FKL33 TaxID=2562307 RepID=UPI0014856187|nr:phosphopantetheine-binding protein [Rhizobium sp. FKL33]